MSPPGVIAVPPPRAPGTVLRLLATNDLLGRVAPLPASWGAGGSVHGVAELLERERSAGPALWLDGGDLSVGGRDGLFGGAALEEIGRLPLAAAVAGNHEFEDGGASLEQFARGVGFPLLCADRDAGLPGSALLDTPAGALGVVGVTHPDVERFSPAPPPDADPSARVVACAQDLRAAGARWVVALLHDGVTWWAGGGGSVATRPARLAATTAGWAGAVDAILCGHTLAAWRGELHGVPAGQAHACAASVLCVDLPAAGGRPILHAPVRVPATPAPASSRAAAAIAAAGRELIGELPAPWIEAPGAGARMSERVALALRRATGADAAFVPAGQLLTRAPLDGVAAALPAGPVTELDLALLFPYAADELAIVELGAGELERLRTAHDTAADPRNVAADADWWNWARVPAGVSSAVAQPATVAACAFTLGQLTAWLGRDLVVHAGAVGFRAALREAWAR